MKIDKTTLMYAGGAILIVIIILLVSKSGRAQSDREFFESQGGGQGSGGGGFWSGGGGIWSGGSSGGSGSYSGGSGVAAGSWPVKYGDYNGNVGLVQTVAKKISGKNIAIDNAFGPNTANAVKSAAANMQFYDSASNMRPNTPDSQVVVSKVAYDAMKKAADGEDFRDPADDDDWWNLDWSEIGGFLGPGGSSTAPTLACQDLAAWGNHYIVDDPSCSTFKKALAKTRQYNDVCCK